MSGKTLSTSKLIGPSPGEQLDSSLSILTVGEPSDWKREGNALPHGAISFVSFSEVTSELLDHFSPAAVYSPVLASSFDCIELATLLQNLGYEGPYCAFAEKLPKPELIEREVRHICRRLSFRIFVAN